MRQNQLPSHAEPSPAGADLDIWYVPFAERLLREPFSVSVLLFNPASGKTHLLNELAMDLLDALAGGPASVGELVMRLDLISERETAEPQIRKLLRTLDRLGLIAPVDP